MDAEAREVGVVLVTVRQAAAMLSIGRTSTYELIAQGELEVVRIGRATRVPVAAVHKLVERRRARASQPGAILRP